MFIAKFEQNKHSKWHMETREVFGHLYQSLMFLVCFLKKGKTQNSKFDLNTVLTVAYLICAVIYDTFLFVQLLYGNSCNFGSLIIYLNLRSAKEITSKSFKRDAGFGASTQLMNHIF